jgi:prophage antirepressor-like protein
MARTYSEIAMNDQLNLFEFKVPGGTGPFSSFAVRVVRGIDGELLWVAKDVAEALGYSVDSGAGKIIAHVPTEWRGGYPIPTPSGSQDMACLSEPGLYFFLARSDKEAALPFQKWIAGEVIPTIRKTGGYGAQVPKTLSEALRLCADLEDRRVALASTVDAQQQTIATLEPKAAFAVQVANTDDTLLVGEFGKVIGAGEISLFKFLRAERILLPTNIPYQEFIDRGYFRVAESIWEQNGKTRITRTTRVTGKGQVFIAKKWRMH